jgi:hypothetical protein
LSKTDLILESSIIGIMPVVYLPLMVDHSKQIILIHSFRARIADMFPSAYILHVMTHTMKTHESAGVPSRSFSFSISLLFESIASVVYGAMLSVAGKRTGASIF